MEKYINDETVVQNEIYETFKDLVKCPICHCIIFFKLIHYIKY